MIALSEITGDHRTRTDSTQARFMTNYGVLQQQPMPTPGKAELVFAGHAY